MTWLWILYGSIQQSRCFTCFLAGENAACIFFSPPSLKMTKQKALSGKKRIKVNSQQNKEEAKRERNNLVAVMFSYPSLLSEAARWLWSWCMRRFVALVKRYPREPRIFSGSWASLAEGGCAEIRSGQKSRQKSGTALKRVKSTVHLQSNNEQ